MKDLLKIRNDMKKKKPDFVRQEGYKRKKLSDTGWRTPRGYHSKMRRKFGGKRKLPMVGFSSPRKVRGLTREGFRPILVHTLNDLSRLKKDNIIILAGSIGLKKRLQLLEKIKSLKLKISNIKNIDEYIKKAKERLEENKKQKSQKLKKQVKEKPKETEKQETKEEKEKKEKEEKRKVLEKK